ncbi:hypothetical protein B0T26DRAFT_528308 [Lasiosphaeria miniovina]|uniref:Methyltransferase n=1 Tax=Lasiosphaeria miniovina TaxID=1954250 RepID=A0AA39ZQC3_9PEZI|nr:uncharacterized protein B0T26DRAFT_528308 [Lasiosphaeria miniovina]KAK0701725.1 hypothetical protein B0T26DRAFT_528308 [Lasiosphaeria miniovina]
MAEEQGQEQEQETVDASFEFLQWQPSYEKHKPYEVFLPLASFSNSNNEIPRSNLAFEPRSVRVRNARGRRDVFGLDTHGFEFARHASAVGDQLKDRSAVTAHYVPEMEAFLQRHLGGGTDVRTFCFDLRLRQSIDAAEFSKRTVNLEDGFDALLPATHPHIDQSMQGAISRVQRHMGDEADRLLKGRVRIVNIWRPLALVRSWPLALCDARTVDANDLVTCDIVRRRYVGETYFGKYNAAQEWHYLSDMDVDDLVLVKVYDSDPDVPAKCCLHASFELHAGAESQPPVRESIELRILVFTES